MRRTKKFPSYIRSRKNKIKPAHLPLCCRQVNASTIRHPTLTILLKSSLSKSDETGPVTAVNRVNERYGDFSPTNPRRLDYCLRRTPPRWYDSGLPQISYRRPPHENAM